MLRMSVFAALILAHSIHAFGADQPFEVIDSSAESWLPGKPFPSYLAKNGVYQNECQNWNLSMGSPFPSDLFYKVTLEIQYPNIVREVVKYNGDSKCQTPTHIARYEVSLQYAYRTYIEGTDEGWANMRVSDFVLTKNDIFLNQADADFLNTYHICDKTWLGEGRNDLKGLDYNKCWADLQALKANPDISENVKTAAGPTYNKIVPGIYFGTQSLKYRQAENGDLVIEKEFNMGSAQRRHVTYKKIQE